MGLIARRLLTLGLSTLAFVCGAWIAGGADAEDIAGSSDYPLVGRYEGSQIVAYSVTDYDETQLIDGPFEPVQASARTGTGFKTVDGRIILIYYALPKGRSTLEVLRNYEASLQAKGFQVPFTCATSDGTCFASRQPDAGYLLGTAVGDPGTLPKLAGDYVHNWFQQAGRYLLARLDRPEGAVYAGLYLGQSQNGNVAVVRVVETKEMETGKIAFVDASQMGQAIADTGKVALYGILFDFDKDTLKPEFETDARRNRQAAGSEAGTQVEDRRAHRQSGGRGLQLGPVAAAGSERGRGAGRRIWHRRRAALLRRRRSHPAGRLQRYRGRSGEEPPGRAHRAVGARGAAHASQ